MARSRTNPSLLEQSRRHWRRLALGGGVVLLLVGGGTFLLRRNPDPRSATPTVQVPQGRVTVEVLNGTRRQGAARTATRILRRRGLDVVFLGNADSLTQTTRILARRGKPELARYVAAVLGMGLVLMETDTLRRVDVSVILGDDFVPRE
jgi:LytR cell envelope-related transcriptional attenuator